MSMSPQRKHRITQPFDKDMSTSDAEEKAKKVQTEIEEWSWNTHHDAHQEASKRQGSLALGSIEAQLRRLSEQMTRQAQEKQEYF